MGNSKEWLKHLPDESEEIDENNLHLFFKTMFERQEIWYRRFIEKMERPWTTNKFFKNHKFTNVYRELDRNTQWQIQNVFLKEKSRKELLWKIMFFRFFNSPEFFDWIATQKRSFKGHIPNYDEFDPEELKNLSDNFRAEGGNPFTNAYLTNTTLFPGKTRNHAFSYHVIPTLHKNIPRINKVLMIAKSAEEIIDVLNSLPSVSDFMSHEFYQDFTYAPRYAGFKLMKFDQNDFTNVGPGCAVGLRLVFPSVKMKSKEQKELIYKLRDLSKEYLAQFGDFKYIEWDGEKYFINPEGDLTLHAIEMWACEFQKYWKMKIGLGKQRSVFQPKTNKLWTKN